ncbi:MAG: hypothetical protein LBH18_01285 [Spirochaetaceae bacterium]|nr:hypothetical protein [Spirochaetaceae bacterium]
MGVEGLNLSTPGDNRTRPTVDGLRLKTLSVYYAIDEDEKNLITPPLTANRGYYVVPDAEAAQGHIAVYAEAESPNLTLNIAWTQGGKTGGMDKDETLPASASISDVPVPVAVTTGNYSDTLVTVTVSDGSKNYHYTAAIQAPGMNSSLASLRTAYDGSAFDEKEYILWKEVANEINFSPSGYDYTIELKDRSKVGNDILISALASSVRSVITLTGNGVGVEEAEAPSENSIRKNGFFIKQEEIDTIEGNSGDENPIEEEPL